MTELIFEDQKWQSWLSDSWIHRMKIYREGGRNSKYISVWVDHVGNPEHSLYNQYIVGWPHCFQVPEMVRCWANFEQAKMMADNILNSLIEEAREGRRNWWTGRDKEGKRH